MELNKAVLDCMRQLRRRLRDEQQIEIHLNQPDAIAAMRRDDAIVAMVGDGFNDMPVLAGAHASFAFGQAVPLAQAKSDVVVMGTSLMTVANTLSLAQKTMKVVRHNLAWSAAYNAICVPLAFMGYLPAWLAGLGMALSSLWVVGYSLRLSRPMAGEARLQEA